jgi:2-dehydro-3-deoxyphosphogluconate aldolase/(4S)-4-hydroxy-2-oxoglutarate aldolase
MRFELFEKLPLVGILRGVTPREIAPLCRSVIAAGLTTIEITMNTDGAPDLIRRLIDCAEGRLAVGAGTVLNDSELSCALAAGASFIVMPTLVDAVVRRCVDEAIPVFPGALTPQEIFAAHSAGATVVKVFPANLFGPSYFRDLRGPFHDIPLLACGGVNAETIGAFFENGATGAAFGGSIFKRAWLEDGAFDRLGEAVRELIDAYRSATGRRSGPV